MTPHDDTKLAEWLLEGPHQGRTSALDDALARAAANGQRPAWLVGLAGGTITDRPGVTILRYAIVVVIVVLLTSLLVGALAAGGLLRPRPIPSLLAIGPTESQSTAPLATLSAPPPTAPPPTGLVAYTATEQLKPGQAGCLPTASGIDASLQAAFCTTTRAWVAGADGSGARALLPDNLEGQEVLGWSADGSRLLVEDGNDLVITDAAGSELTRLTIMRMCKEGTCTGGAEFLCTYPCAGVDGLALSPDGTRVAFATGSPDVENTTVIAVADLGTGRVTELAATRTTNPDPLVQCSEVSTCEGEDGRPRWSPDGNRIVFERQDMSPEPGVSWTSAALFVVDADGGNFRRVTPTGMMAIDPEWSPDGTRLVFTTTDYVVNADHTSVLTINADIATIGVDGSAFTRLTSDGISARPNWTADGRLAFQRDAGTTDPSRFADWIMDADGGNQVQVGRSLADLSAAGCTICLYPLPDTLPTKIYPAYWQPIP